MAPVRRDCPMIDDPAVLHDRLQHWLLAVVGPETPAGVVMMALIYELARIAAMDDDYEPEAAVELIAAELRHQIAGQHARASHG